MTQGSFEFREYIQNQLVPSAIGYFSSTLKIIRETEPLMVDFECADLVPPKELGTVGVDADLIILVTAMYFEETFVAAALPCALLDNGR